MKKLLVSALALALSASPALALYGGTVNQGGAAASGPWLFTPWLAGAVVSATNGIYTNLLQGNAVLSSSNPLPANTAQVNGVTVLTGAGATGTGSQRETVAQDTTTIAGSAPGTAGTPSSNVVSVQGVTSGTAVTVVENVTASGGWTPGNATALTNSATSIKASAGQLGSVLCYNPNASITYVQIFNLASGSVTLGSSTPVYVVPIPVTLNGGIAFGVAGLQFSTAISFAATTTPTGSTAPGTALVCSYGYN